VQRVRQHAEYIDIIILAELLKLKRLVSLMPIKDEQPRCPNYLALCTTDKILQSLNSNLLIVANIG
jgi:hypothetical protein